MDLKDFLTNEKVTKKFGSQFELVNYAIKLAENMILSGRESRYKSYSQNSHATQVLNEILNNVDQLEEIVVPVVENPNEGFSYSRKDESQTASGKSAERKRGRKILSDG